MHLRKLPGKIAAIAHQTKRHRARKRQEHAGDNITCAHACTQMQQLFPPCVHQHTHRPLALAHALVDHDLFMLMCAGIFHLALWAHRKRPPPPLELLEVLPRPAVPWCTHVKTATQGKGQQVTE
eukprot:1156876-Pelagomonas_calceolata.AAC.5